MTSVAQATLFLRDCARCNPVRYGIYAALAAAAILLALTLFWWAPAKREHAQLTEKIDAKRSVMVEEMRSDQVARAHREVLPPLKLLEKKLGTHTGQADLIQGIARLASRQNVRITSRSFDEGKTETGVAPLFLEIGLSGSYPSLKQLMADLATLPMWIEVVDARLERSGEGGSQVRAQWRLLTYRELKGQR